MKVIVKILMGLLLFTSCSKDTVDTEPPITIDSEFITAVDASSYPEIKKTNPVFYDSDGNKTNFFEILKEKGINTIRLKLWVNPDTEHGGFNEVKEFTKELRTYGFKIWLTVHYSDTWADPGNQETPEQWKGVSFEKLKELVQSYTEKIAKELKPDFIQIGNEINTGFLHPYGHISNNYESFKSLMSSAIQVVRANSSTTKIIIHFAGIEGANWFYDKVKTLDYDIIGLSYYPIWHGKSIDDLKNKLQALGTKYKKEVMIAETAYPFTLTWNDFTNNIVGKEDQLILPEYPATKEGQVNYIRKIITSIKEIKGLGVCYWGAELIAWKGTKAMDGSPWENQALFDFNNHALPVLEVFKTE